MEAERALMLEALAVCECLREHVALVRIPRTAARQLGLSGNGFAI